MKRKETLRKNKEENKIYKAPDGSVNRVKRGSMLK